MKSRVLILGAGFAGHTAALHLSKHLDEVDVTVVSPRNRFTWFPSLIWVGVGTMAPERCHFALDEVYATSGDRVRRGPRSRDRSCARRVARRARLGRAARTLDYDFLINATGPYLNFEGTPGLGPSAGNSESVCSVEHATRTGEAYRDDREKTPKGRTRAHRRRHGPSARDLRGRGVRIHHERRSRLAPARLARARRTDLALERVRSRAISASTESKRAKATASFAAPTSSAACSSKRRSARFFPPASSKLSPAASSTKRPPKSRRGWSSISRCSSRSSAAFR